MHDESIKNFLDIFLQLALNIEFQSFCFKNIHKIIESCYYNFSN